MGWLLKKKALSVRRICQHATILEGQSWALDCFCHCDVFSKINWLPSFLDFLSNVFLFCTSECITCRSTFTTFAKQSMINRLSNPINCNRSAAKTSKVMSSSVEWNPADCALSPLLSSPPPPPASSSSEWILWCRVEGPCWLCYLGQFSSSLVLCPPQSTHQCTTTHHHHHR